MIDFRYHLVSLISVFLALAVGIVLGAGPLRDTIGETLTGQVQDLRVDRERLRADLEASEMAVTERNTFIEGTAPTILADLLPEREVAVVTLPGTEPDDVEMVRTRLDQAGAQVVAEVAVTEAWSDPDNRSFRQTFAGQLLGYLAPAPAQDADTAEIFGIALGQALTGTEGEDGEADAETLLELLVSAETPLATLTSEPSALADATVLVGPRAEEPPAAENTPDEQEQIADEEERTAHRELAAALALTGEGSVTVGAAEGGTGLVADLRAESDGVTTVDSVGEVTAGVSTPMALAVAMSGSQGHYGSEPDADEAVPPRSPLPPPAPTLPGNEDGEAPEGGLGGAGDSDDADGDAGDGDAAGASDDTEEDTAAGAGA